MSGSISHDNRSSSAALLRPGSTQTGSLVKGDGNFVMFPTAQFLSNTTIGSLTNFGSRESEVADSFGQIGVSVDGCCFLSNTTVQGFMLAGRSIFRSEMGCVVEGGEGLSDMT